MHILAIPTYNEADSASKRKTWTSYRT